MNQRVFAEQNDISRGSDTQTQTSREPGLNEENHWWRIFVQRIIRRIIWEFHPTIWSYADPLPVTYRIGFTCACAFMNIQRRFCSRLMPEAENVLEPNDFLIDHPYIRFRLLPTGGNLFVHFPDIEEMLEDLAFAGFTVVEYRSLEELQQGQVLSEKERRSKRLILLRGTKTRIGDEPETRTTIFTDSAREYSERRRGRSRVRRCPRI